MVTSVRSLQTIKMRKTSLRKLRMISALLDGESMVSILARLISAELSRLQGESSSGTLERLIK